MQRKNRGMTMIELMLVVLIIAILAVLLFTNYWLQQAKAHDTKRKVELEELRKALISYEVDKSRFPVTEDVVCGSEALKPYINKVPCEPDGTSFYYETPALDKFIAYTNLEWASDPEIGRKGCWVGCGPNYSYNYYVTYGMEPKTDFNAVESGNIPGVKPTTPTCGTITKYCYANLCSSCCPGARFRCDDTGAWCIPDSSCL